MVYYSTQGIGAYRTEHMEKRMTSQFIRRRISFSIAGLALSLAIVSVSFAKLETGHATPKQAWPDNGIAQRRFPNGSTMFVEDDKGKLRAWVLSETTGSKHVEALDFFSGERMKVEVNLEEDGRQNQSFTDAQGVFHTTVGSQFYFSGTSLPIDLPGISFDGKTIFLDESKNYCASSMTSAIDKKAPTLSGHFTIYHRAANPKVCSGGHFNSKITSALDLNDGTFLGVEDCFVFRLRKSDFSTVGSAPALRVVDEAALQTAINQAKARNAQDVTEYVAKALNLPSAPELSCNKE